MTESQAIDLIRAELRKRDVPVNMDSNNRRGIGIDIRERKRGIYEGKRKRVLIGEGSQGLLSITYNKPFDSDGNIITYGSESIYDEVVAVLEQLELRHKPAPYGLFVMLDSYRGKGGKA